MNARLAGLLVALRRAARDPGRDRFWQMDGAVLSPQLPLSIWVGASLLFITSYVFMWSFVHVHIDMRPCGLVLNDPLFALIPYDRAWYWFTHDVYEWVTVASVVTLVVNAATGDHRPLVVWGSALGLQALLRSVTLLLLPLCRVTVAPGTRAIEAPTMLDLGFTRIPWRVWASNDLVFSGHVGEFLLLYWATRHWHRNVRIALVAFQLIQAYGLLATRGHYTIDLVIAVPCALLEYRLALWLIRHAGGAKPAVTAAA